ncbi:hypothetical protein [Blastococcus sp. LR1]|uniref:hypothetical protein n=1 Tax=Blastococcus sp. LR1 TaxID=2877000 RepID=UPI001CC987DA|nr:hypothetical protein [Blastococcus sp. LR1]MCA0145510.1 hypothetical protein [Blastococcus sp. LR1]
MRMTFRRMADRRPVETLVERDDGVVFAMRGAGGGTDLPHDLVHAVVEAELQVRDGIWGCVADGVVWRSMRHVSGRQPPHAAERSEQLKRERAAAIQRAEALADLVGRLATGAEVLPHEVAAANHPAAGLDGAARALREASARWTALAPGQVEVVTWTSLPRRAAGRRRSGR